MDNYSVMFKILADETRLKILSLLGDQELCACKILDQLAIGQSTLSHHMKILCDADFVVCRKQGKWSHYSIRIEQFQKMHDYLKQFIIVPSNQTVKDCSCED